MREKRKKENFDQESSKRNALMQTCGFMMSQVSLPIKWDYRAKDWRWYCSFIPKIFVVATWSLN
jgi:hypothetical protein